MKIIFFVLLLCLSLSSYANNCQNLDSRDSKVLCQKLNRLLRLMGDRDNETSGQDAFKCFVDTTGLTTYPHKGTGFASTVEEAQELALSKCSRGASHLLRDCKSGKMECERL